MSKSKRIEGLDCESAARAGNQFVLRAKHDEMCSLREAALDFTDIEGVHKMRVASRRLRSALRDFQPHLSKTISSRRLKAVARSLGAVRDEDVAIEMMEGLLAEADESAREGIGQLSAERRARREKARARLAAALSIGALGELREKFIAQLSRAAAESRAAQAAATAATATAAATAGATVAATAEAGGERVAAPHGAGGVRFAEVGGEVVRDRFRELKESARSLYRPFEVEPLHEMRIRGGVGRS